MSLRSLHARGLATLHRSSGRATVLAARVVAGSAAWMLAATVPGVTAAERLVPPSAAQSDPGAAQPPYVLAGVNVAGAEFGSIPGKLGREYAYPSDAIIGYFLDAGVTALRIPFRWERIQPALDGPLDPANAAEMDRVVRRATSRGASVILDMHNYGRRVVDGVQTVIAESGGTVSAAHLADGWSRIAARYRDNPRVVFGLMNEPHDQDGATWVATQNAVVAAIRGIGANNLALVTGTAYSGAHSWDRSGNARALLATIDPAGNSAVEAHQYFDANNSGYYEDRDGSSASCTPGSGARRLRPFTDWLRATRRKGFIGEFGAPGNARCLAELRAFYGHLAENADVYIGATGWAAFPHSDYVLNLAPPSDRLDVDTPIFTELRRSLLGRTKPLAAVIDLPAGGDAGASFPGGQIFGVGGSPGYRYDIAQGTLPPGLDLDAATGRIGTATLGAPGTYRFVPRVTDDTGTTALGEEWTIRVAAAPEGRFDTPTIRHFGYTNRAVSAHSFAGENRYALVAVFGRDLDKVVGVTCGGRPMTRLAESFEPQVAGAAIYGLADPPAGSQDIVVSLGGAYKLVSTVVQGVTGIDPRRPVAAVGTAAGIDTRPALALPAPPDTEIWQALNARDPVAVEAVSEETVIADVDPPDANLGQIRVTRRAAASVPQAGGTRLAALIHWRAAAVALRHAKLTNPHPSGTGLMR
ncbi:cellulase family glycosylhydrolase [Methylorubrum extorquens]|uniref:cellulase family glycosylhydrolase n=1 Tax=Methylorubrum extorquens TaxID=408 RepID=UPI002238B5AF|nr:cellulase family glycosylhydrolase [Methylorubrum extorquens]UYW26643.1 cellulase family glycosylhydrolase [Methylorubrum extorquens]